MKGLEKNVSQDPNAVEEYFCIPFRDALMRSPKKLDPGQSEILIRLLLAGPKWRVPDKQCPTEMNIAATLLKSGVRPVSDPRVPLFIGAICDRPGMVVMWCAYIHYWCKINQWDDLTLEIVAQRIIPFGILEERILKELWYSVKLEDGINLLDCEKAYESILT